MRLDPASDMLGVIDGRPTFMPGGEWQVADGDAVVPMINRLLGGMSRRGFAAHDWHMPENVSFASSQPGRQAFDEIGVAFGRALDYCVAWSAEHAVVRLVASADPTASD